MHIKFVSFNINGIQSFVSYIKTNHSKSLNSYFTDTLQADIICLQEMRYSHLHEYSSLKDYILFYSINKSKKGYCGVATFVRKNLYVEKYEVDDSGRWVLTDHSTFKVLNVYFPYLDEQMENVEVKREEIKVFYRFIEQKTDKLTILLGDFNAVYRMEDHYQYLAELKSVCTLNLQTLPTPKSFFNPTELPFKFYNKNDLSEYFFSVFQRKWLLDFLAKNTHKDSCAMFNKQKFTCWNTKLNLRIKNLGTRIDLILVPDGFIVKDAWINQYLYGSDHCPVFCVIDLEVLNKENNLCNVKNNLFHFLKQN